MWTAIAIYVDVIYKKSKSEIWARHQRKLKWKPTFSFFPFCVFQGHSSVAGGEMLHAMLGSLEGSPCYSTARSWGVIGHGFVISKYFSVVLCHVSLLKKPWEISGYSDGGVQRSRGRTKNNKGMFVKNIGRYGYTPPSLSLSLSINLYIYLDIHLYFSLSQS